MIRSRKQAIARLLELRKNEETAKRRELGAAVTRLAAADAAEVASRRALESSLEAQRSLLAETSFDSARVRRAVVDVTDHEHAWKKKDKERIAASERRDRAEAEYRAARSKTEALARLIQRRLEAERVAEARAEQRSIDAVALARHVRTDDALGIRAHRTEETDDERTDEGVHP